ncbi:MAG: glycosyltransferase family 1 protein [Anaerolineae bacterium]|nr:glycosyltransferase family 4 protein [Candidatus Roseilinea sp.]MDW8448418.1 glycosyltransferase family 1 protein [Anaerolineae bacterium]
MRIGIDARYLSHGLVGGINTFLKNLIPALIEASRGHHRLYLYADTKRPFDLAGDGQTLPDHVALRLLPYRNPLSSLRNDFLLSRDMRRDGLDVYHFVGNYGFGPAGATALTIHDEINLMPLSEIIRGHPKKPKTIVMMTYLHLATRAAARRADLIITISDYSKRRIAHYGALDPVKIVVVHHGCPADVKRIEDALALAKVRERLGLSKPFILAEAFKNPDVIVRAWRALPAKVRDARQIVFFSRSPQVLPVVHEAINAGWAKLFVRVTRPDLSALYSMAEAFVFPSWIEGFGMPLVEAMTCGAPIIASDRGAIPEVVGDAGLLMDAEDDRKLAEHLMRLFQQPEEREHLRRLGFKRAEMFTWQRAAQGYLEAYLRVVSHSVAERRPVLTSSL